MSKTYVTPSYYKRYYMHDARDNTIVSFATKEKMVKYLAKRTKYYFKKDYINIDDLVRYQNISGNDTFCHYKTEYVRDKRNFLHVIKSISTYNKPFTFYYLGMDNYYHIFNIAEWIDDIENEKDNLNYFSSNNWCKEYRCHPYQVKSHHYGHRKMKTLYVEKEYMHYFHNIKNNSEIDVYGHYCTRSERSWKKQSKKRHQYGNGSRDKYTESDFFSIENIDDIEFEMVS